MPVPRPSPGRSLTENRHNELAGIVASDGTIHGRTDATSAVQLVPDDPAATSYTGGYVSRETGTYARNGQDDRITTTTVHGTLQGSDGSSLRFNQVAHLTTSHDGTLRVSFDRFRCTG